MSLRKFFYMTSIMLILVASGILGYGVHELLEYLEEIGVEVGLWTRPIYIIRLDPSHPLHERNILGSLLTVLIGYTMKMELLRALLQSSYLLIALTFLLRAYKVRPRQRS
mgnify:CR=1 FL=1